MAKSIVVASSFPQAQKEEQERQWSDLLPELLSLVLSNLFAKDNVTFRMVCKSWGSTSKISRPLVLSATDFPLSQGPYLMFLQRKPHSFNFFHPVCDASYQMDIPELLNSEIRFSKYNWLLMRQGDRSIYFFNPFTKARIDLPDIPSDYVFQSMCFSAPPTSPECLVVGFLCLGTAMEIYTLKLGEEDWTIVEYESSRRFFLSRCSPVLCNGSYYCLGEMGDLGIFNPTNDGCAWTVCVKPLQRLRNPQQSFIVESDGDLFSVFVAREGRKVYVCRLDSSKKAWRDVESLGDKMLYVCTQTSFSETALVRGTGNKIYFPKFHGNHGVFYSLATKKFHSFSGDYSRSNFYDTKEMKHCTWVKPML